MLHADQRSKVDPGEAFVNGWFFVLLRFAVRRAFDRDTGV
jgi:hypothetical protein